MNKLGHLVLGFILGIITLSILYYLNIFSLSFESILISILVIIIFSLLSDLDVKSGSIVWIFLTLSLIGLIYSYFFYNELFPLFILFLFISVMSPQVFKHRGFTHTITFGLIISIMIYYFLGLDFGILAFVCFYSHLLGDSIFFKFL